MQPTLLIGLVLLDQCQSTKTDWHRADLLWTECGSESVPRSVFSLNKTE